MSIGVQAFQGRRLRQARISRGLFKNALADMVGLSKTAITRYEDGTDKPQHERLSSLANHLGFPYEFFLKPVWGEDVDLVFWRTRSADSKAAREMTEQRMDWLCEIFGYLESEVDFPALELPDLRLPTDFRLISSEAIEKAAEALRKHWHLGLFPIPDVVLALENAGIPVVMLDLVSDKQDGFCFRSNNLTRSFVGINTTSISCARARYDCAHELGHIVLHRNVTPNQERDPVLHKQIEQQAHRFAGAFLFPKQSFFDEVVFPSLDYFSSLKRRWGISIAAMVYRAHDLGIIDDHERADLFRKLVRRKWRGALREPFDSREEMPLEKPRMLRRGVDAVLSEGSISRAGLLSVITLPEQEVEKLTGTPEGFFQASELVQLAVPKNSRLLRSFDHETGEIIEFTKRFK